MTRSINEHLDFLYREINRLGRHTTEPNEFIAVDEIGQAIEKARVVYEQTKDLDEKEPMKKHEIYLQLESMALGGNYTADQVRNTTFDQARDLLGRSDFSVTFFMNMKARLLAVLNDRDDGVDFKNVKDKVKTWLDSNFPNWEAERERDGDKPSVTFWLEGKP